MKESETPRTDAVFWSFHTHDDVVSLARELERDLIATQGALDQMTEDAVRMRKVVDRILALDPRPFDPRLP